MGGSIVDWIMDHILPWVIIMAVALALLLLFVFLPVAIYEEAVAETFELKKQDWICTTSHKETHTSYVYTGNGKSGMMLPVNSTSDTCDTWSRKED